MGPVASQEAIKMLGTNGGGFFNANSSHPFENPTALTNLVQMLAIFDPGGAVLRLWRCGGRSPSGTPFCGR
jgi:K+-transporting ATPase A subunit